MIGRLWRYWVALWSHQEPATAMAFAMAFGVVGDGGRGEAATPCTKITTARSAARSEGTRSDWGLDMRA